MFGASPIVVAACALLAAIPASAAVRSATNGILTVEVQDAGADIGMRCVRAAELDRATRIRRLRRGPRRHDGAAFDHDRQPGARKQRPPAAAHSPVPRSPATPLFRNDLS